jgi:hypothetical protein
MEASQVLNVLQFFSLKIVFVEFELKAKVGKQKIITYSVNVG